jgi:hypothetical protein
MDILTQGKHVDGEMSRRGRARIAGSARVSPATMVWDILSPGFAAIDIGEVDDRRTISTNHAPATNFGLTDSPGQSGAPADTAPEPAKRAKSSSKNLPEFLTR